MRLGLRESWKRAMEAERSGSESGPETLGPWSHGEATAAIGQGPLCWDFQAPGAAAAVAAAVVAGAAVGAPGSGAARERKEAT